ncbi:uncharacterized protein [Venturia canescens]|uniref:uncharacterized protein n=1 Tax=Venturia canescens TaxID=32260 RepID=UPI001C9BEA78|nr:uncharacterized protein LOC122418599 [Venturia canescens]
MHRAELNKEKNILRRIASASDAIRRKHKMLKLGKMTAEKAMSEIFKPVMNPLEKLVDQSVKQESAIKKEPNEESSVKKEDEFIDNEDDEFERSFQTAHGDISEEDISFEDDDSIKRDDLSQNYLNMFDTVEKKELDTSYGVRKLQGNRLMIGNSPITFERNIIRIGDKTFDQSEGLLELLFKKSPDESRITTNDRENYRKILNSTNAYRKHYIHDHAIRNDNSRKFKNIIAQMIDSPMRKSSPTRHSERLGKSLPGYKIFKRNSTLDYVYWDDPNELVDRLRLLYASQVAGNASHVNEIISIIEELREAQIIY